MFDFLVPPGLVALTSITQYAARTLYYGLLQAVAVYFLWNASLPGIVAFVKPITYAQALFLVILIRVLGRSWSNDAVVETAVDSKTMLYEIHGILYKCLVAIVSLHPSSTQQPNEDLEEDQDLVEDENNT